MAEKITNIARQMNEDFDSFMKNEQKDSDEVQTSFSQLHKNLKNKMDNIMQIVETKTNENSVQQKVDQSKITKFASILEFRSQDTFHKLNKILQQHKKDPRELFKNDFPEIGILLKNFTENAIEYDHKYTHGQTVNLEEKRKLNIPKNLFENKEKQSQEEAQRY